MHQEAGQPVLSAWRRLMAGVESLPPNGLTREDFAALVRRFEGERIYVPKADARAERLAYVRELFERGNPRALVVELLRARFALSRSQAYEVAAQAVAATQPPAAESAEQKE